MKKLKIFILLIFLVAPLYFVGCENKNKASLNTPTNVFIDGSVIVFDAIHKADYYTISINEREFVVDATHNSNVQIIDNKINFDASQIFITGESYSIKVKANSAKHNNSQYSSAITYKYNGEINKPDNVKINSTTLTWDLVENASFYLVKIITPNDKIIFDKDGNQLTNDDALSIEKADLTEYSFNTNKFDFGSLLNEAGKYKFYVSAVCSNASIYVESGYTNKVTYTHYVTLNTPTAGIVKEIDDELHLATVVDEKANAISILCGDFEKTVEINGADNSLTLYGNNLIDVNLNKYFAEFISNGKLSLNNITQYSFKVQSKYLSTNDDNSFYVNSDYSKLSVFENTLNLPTPTLSVVYNSSHDCYVANWESNYQLMTGYELFVISADGLKKYNFDSDVTSYMLNKDFVAVAVKSVGFGNYLSSNLSDFIANPENNENIPELNYDTFNTTLSWDEVEDASYIIEFNNEQYFTSSNNFEIPLNKITNNETSIKLIALKEHCIPLVKEITLTFTAQLSTPTISYNQGFSSTNLYELTFTGVDNALGYYIYVKSKDETEYSKIDLLYTTTKIDLSQYIISEGEYTDYMVKIQAVADMHSIYSDSDLSYAISVSHVKVLEKPEFYKINSIDTPISKQIAGNTAKYILKFYGVEDAGSYEVLINYNKISVNAKNYYYTGIYEVDVSNYLISANNYEIKVRAIPRNTSFNVKPSEYAISNYALTKQLSMVENINVTENEGVFTLSFDPIDNAESYRIRIVKENDANYVDYLNDLGLSISFDVTQSTDISAYVQQQGVYYFYVTALAPKHHSYYADAQESTTYGTVNKLTSLEAPYNITFTNISKDKFLLSWLGDDNADYYLIKITDPNQISHEFKVYSATSSNINKYITVQGDYTVSIYSMINAIGDNSKEFTSSAASTSSTRYIYETEDDFLRHSIYMYGKNYNFIVTNAEELKNLLWYHYLYEINSATGLSLMVEPQLKEDNTTESLRETIVRIATEMNNSLIYNFSNDEEWLELVNEQTTTDNVLFSYLCQKVIVAYPEFNVLENFNINHTTASKVFNLVYRNALNSEKIEDTETNKFTNTNYANDYTYIDLFSRRSNTGVFKIDSREEMIVSTTEQLLQAVQHNRKPKFVGNSEIAENVYNNAKLILSAIVTNNMTDLEKVTAIFDWLSYGYDVTYYDINNKAYISGSIEKTEENIPIFGQYKQYYLEGIFSNISMEPNGNIIIGNKQATSNSYSKAFALLCAIEGIEAIIIDGSYSYYDASYEIERTVEHHWNKVYLDTTGDSGKKWYAVDLTFSDNRINFNNFKSGYGMASHSHFLTTDSFNESSLNLVDKTHLISSTYDQERTCETQFNYYGNSSFAMSYENIEDTIFDFENKTTTCSSFEYSKEYSPNENYQLYAKTTGYGKMQSFLLNTIIYAKYNANKNTSKRSMFEFRFNWSDNGGSNIFDIAQLRTMFDSVPNQYGLTLKLIPDINGTIHYIENSETKTTTIVYIVEKTE